MTIEELLEDEQYLDVKDMILSLTPEVFFDERYGPHLNAIRTGMLNMPAPVIEDVPEDPAE